MSVYELVDHESAVEYLRGGLGLPVSGQCRLLGISRSRYYQWRKLREARKAMPERQYDGRKEEELALVDKILGVWTENPAWGYRKLGRYLQRNGFPSATEKRVRLIYQRLGIHGVSPVFRTTRQPKGKCLKHPYLLRGKKIRFSNQVWETDITYIRLPGGMVYLTAFIDVYSRRILSWSLGRTMESGLCVDALHEAVMNHGIPAILNTDCGSQYLGGDFLDAASSYGIEISNDSVGRCLDDVFIERTWRTLKYECIFLHEWGTMEEPEKGLGIFIRKFNFERPHQSLDYRTPDEVYTDGRFPSAGDEPKKTEVA